MGGDPSGLDRPQGIGFDPDRDRPGRAAKFSPSILITADYAREMARAIDEIGFDFGDFHPLGSGVAVTHQYGHGVGVLLAT